jgi:polyhydroxyalkanoate synthesis repressor PhaR
MADKTSSKAPIIIKKYANRRLYNTATSTYVTLEDLARMVQEGVEFVVQDAKTKEDLTRSVLTQIIVEEEQKGQSLLPINFLRQLIAFYGDSMRWMVPQYLDSMMAAFARNQEQLRRQFQSSMGGVFPFGPIEEMSKQNLAMFEQAMRMFNPFAPRPPEREANGAPRAQPERPEPQPAERAGGPDAIEELRRQLAAMQRQLDALSRRKQD